jgi:ferrous iron transport protein A
MPGKTVQVVKITGGGAIKRRIMDMGITKGVDVFVRKVAPLGDPVEVTVRGYELSLRKADAESIEVEGGGAGRAGSGGGARRQ